MHWDQILTVFAIIATNLGTVLALYFNLDKKLDENRKEANERMEEHRKETNQILEAIRQDIRDFHGRLCAIEERNRGK